MTLTLEQLARARKLLDVSATAYRNSAHSYDHLSKRATLADVKAARKLKADEYRADADALQAVLDVLEQW
jgi:hypothetical protein